MTVIRKRKGGIARLATVVLAAAAVAPMLLVGGTGTSQAACSSFRFNGTTTIAFVGDNATINFASSNDRVPATVNVLGQEGFGVVDATGGVVAGRSLSIDLSAPGPPGGGTILLRGDINDAGVGSGTASVFPDGGDRQDLQFTTTGAPLVCADVAPKAINVSWQEFIGGIKATVSMSNNTGQVGCTYSTKGLETFDRRFTLTDDKPTEVTISPAVPLFQVWPVTITCDNGVRLETERFY